MRNLMVEMDSIIRQSGKIDMLEVMLAAGSINLKAVNGTYSAVWSIMGHKLYANAATVGGLVDALHIEIIKFRDSLRASDEG